MSAGVGVFPADGDSYERLLVKADRRMYQEKARRKRTSLKALVDVSRHERVRPFRAS
jgi:GGDEF domain-containing protein